MKHASAARLLAVLLACAALPAMAAQEPAQEDFTGKYLCVEDADWSWGLSHAKVVKVGGKEFLAGEEVPPPEPARLEVKTKDAAAKLKGDETGSKADESDVPQEHPKQHPPHKAKTIRCRVLLPLDKVMDIRVFDTQEDLDNHLEGVNDTAIQEDEPKVF